jgi:VanZ family protein
MTANQHVNWPRKISLAVLTVYWALLFVGTHIPRLPTILPLPSDKVMHAGAITMLSFLFALAWSLRRPFGWRQFLAVLAILAVYAAFDEVTQPLMQRTADPLDWIADVAGALGGLASFFCARAIWRRMAQRVIE